MVGYFLIWQNVYGQSVSELKNKIEEKQADIVDLDRQIEKLGKELVVVEGQKNSLKKELNRIELTGQTIQAKIKRTTGQISVTELGINKTEDGIGEKQSNINKGKDTLKTSLQIIRDKEDNSILEIILSEKTISSFFREIHELNQLQQEITNTLNVLEKDKTDLSNKKNELTKQRRELVLLEESLKDEKRLNDQIKQEQRELVRETENKESSYLALLEEIKNKRAEFEKELFNFESQLKITIDPDSYPSAGTFLFNWPLDKIYITQYFGNTQFASKNTQAYAGLGHNGIDLRASVGTRVLAPLSGTVRGTGDTDLTCRRASYGRWVLVDHNNGLTTLYAHLSLIKVKEGDRVNTGDIIAYSGNTGYSTGPHLHFSTFATKGVEIGQLQSKVRGCGVYTLPRASFNAYLNPLDYLAL